MTKLTDGCGERTEDRILNYIESIHIFECDQREYIWDMIWKLKKEGYNQAKKEDIEIIKEMERFVGYPETNPYPCWQDEDSDNVKSFIKELKKRISAISKEVQNGK